MKSLQKVIKNKNRLINLKSPESNSISELLIYHHTGKKLVYLVKDLNNENIIELVQQITPLIYYLIIKLKTEEENLLTKLVITLHFPPCANSLILKRSFKIDDENPLNSIQDFINNFKRLLFNLY